MKVRDGMTTELVTASPWETAAEVACKMRDHKVGCVLISNEGKLLGLITDREIALRCVAEARNPQTTRIEEIMIRNPFTIAPDFEMAEAARLFGQHKVRRFPVVEDGQKLLGILSVADVAPDFKTYFDGIFHELVEWRHVAKGQYGGGEGAWAH
ncbi:CBS domain-containing protein [Candidatus Methylomirabilis sp.]|uniref:CBS domain-containing protein n=1 Tax=Candidatus Methylomirabilis sp. TaxID=2032687 RepID=UPI003C706B4E